MAKKSDKMTLAQAITSALRQAMEEDPSIIVMGEDVGKDGGVFRLTEGLYEKFGEKRVIDTPLAESGIVGTAIGLSIGGFRPIVEIQFMDFMYPALNQMLAHVARYRNRSRGKYPVRMVLRMPFGGGIHPPEHHSESLETPLLHTAGLKVVAPSNPYDAKGLLISALKSDDPVVFMEPKRIYRAFKEEVPEEAYTVPIGKAKVVREGKDITLITFGATVRVALDAATELKDKGFEAEVVDLRTLNPLDIDTILGSVEKTGRAVVVHEAPKILGIGAEIAALIQERALLHLLAPIERVTGLDIPFPLPMLENHYLPDKARIVSGALKTLNY
jgi:pyruvate dehydrogenase E1 component beta subunit